jgi:hypothetical protein
MGTQAMERRKRETQNTYRDSFEDWENGKPRDKNQRKLNEFTDEE